MSTLYIRHPARAEGEGALSRYALVDAAGALVQQGEGVLRGLGDLVAASRRVLLIVAATDVTLLTMPTPPLSGARLKAALPGLVEEHILGDPAESVLVPGPHGADKMRAIAVVQRAWLEPIVRTIHALGARSVVALPAQLCLPLQPGNVSGAIDHVELILRHGQYQGLGLAISGTPEVVLQTARAMAGDAPLTLYVPPAQLGEYQVVANQAAPGVSIAADAWEHWVAGSKTTTLDLVPALGAGGARARDWRRWRWPLGLALATIVVNLAGLNVEWLRLRREAEVTRQAMLQTFRTAYPKEQVILDPQAQMRKNISLAKANSGQVSPDEFTWLTGALAEAAQTLPSPLSVVSLDYRERGLTVKVKPESADPGRVGQLKSALAARNLSLTETAPATWLIRTTGGKQ